jgi:hypothetical protein
VKYICFFEAKPEEVDKILEKWSKREEEREKDPEVDVKYTKVLFPPHAFGSGLSKGFSVDEASPEQIMNTTMFWFPEMKVEFVPIYDLVEVSKIYLKSKEKH